MEEVNGISKKTKNNTISVYFLVVVVLSTILMHFYNSSIKSDIENTKNEITKYEKSITELENNKKLQIFSLLDENKNVIEEYKRMNKISMYINHMNVMQAKYELKLKGFNLSNGELVSSIEIDSDLNGGIAYQKTRDFLKNYRTDSKALFDLDFVNQIEGMDEMRFKAYFNIKK